MSSSTITPELSGRINSAIKSIPSANRVAPSNYEAVADPESGLQRINDWAFGHGFGYVKFSGSTAVGRYSLRCCEWRQDTRNTRKTLEKDQKRVNTVIAGTACPVRMSVTLLTKTGQWSIHHGKNHLDHNHPPAVDPFLLYPHRERVPGRKKALEMASDLRGIVSWAEAKAALDRKGLRLTRLEFYNCLRKEGAREKMDSQQELLYIVALLEEEGFHVAVREVYLLGPNREPVDRVVRDIFFIYPEQIRLRQRFASNWVYITDATFNTNELRLPLLNMVSIDNTGKTVG
jgi:hypothetical protein